MKRTFLIPVATALAALAGTAESAATHKQPENVTPANQPNNLSSSEAHLGTTAAKVVDVVEHGDLFRFILARAESGNVVAYHESHRSHSSHRSHYSSRN